MGQANSFQPTDYQVESSERVTVFDCTFRKLEPDNVEHVLSRSDVYYFKFLISFTFSVNLDPELLRVVFTRDPLFDSVEVGQSFPLQRSSDLKTGGFLEEIGYFSQIGPCIEHSCELFIPKSLADRRLCGFLLDADDVVVAKARGIVAFEDEFGKINNILESRVSLERMSRVEGLSRLNQLENEMLVQNAFAGITETLKSLGPIKKSKVEYVEARDSTRLAYRSYHCHANVPSAILILLAGNSHFHDIIASQLAATYSITVYIFELRGFGYSGGRRGTADNSEQLMGDIRTFVRFIKMNNVVPVFLGGHYHQGGLLLNYGTWSQRESVDGYVFISPFMGAGVENSTNLLAESLDSTPRKSQSSANSYSALASIADALFGREQEYHLYLAEIERELNPMIVEHISSTIMKAYTPQFPKKQFESLDKPFGFWVGEKEELIIPEQIVKYPQKAKVLNSVNMLPGLTHMGVFNECYRHIGDWIMNLDTVNKRHLNLDLNSQMVLSSENGYKHSILRDVDVVVKSYFQLGLKDGKQSFLLSNDGAQIPYRIFTSKNRPLANLILLQADIKVVSAYILVQKCDLAIYVMDLRGVDNASVCTAKDSILNDVKCMVRHLKFNYPEMPLFLGGHGFGASVALAYSNWKNKEGVNAYLFLSPILDPESRISSDMKITNKHNMDTLFSRNQSSSFWFYPKMRRSYSSASSMTFLSQMRISNSTPDLARPENLSSETSSLLWEALVCRNLRRIVSEIDVPFGFWIGSDDELTYASAVVDMINSAKTNISMKQVVLIPHTSHVGNIIVSTAYIAPFLKLLIKAVAPSLSFKIRHPALDDFDRLDFIGKGSFGRVYLVKHKLSGKFFAMKVLSKKEIVEAKEVAHVISERNILQDLNSSFAASFVGSFQNHRSLYILMEFVIGGELYTQLCLRKRFSEDVARFYAAEVLLFLEDVHSQNIIYRDLKPENILLDAMGHIKLVDFGFSKYIVKHKTYTFCGTPQYIAPEVLMNSESRGRKAGGYGVAVDYYSLGILIFEMLVGHTPFFDNNVRAIYRKVLYGTFEFPKWIDPVSKDLINSLIERDPSKRLGSAQSHSIENIKKHRWFKYTDWERLRKREIAAPFVPKFTHAADTSNFLPWGNQRNSIEQDKKHDKIVDYGDIFVNF